MGIDHGGDPKLLLYVPSNIYIHLLHRIRCSKPLHQPRSSKAGRFLFLPIMQNEVHQGGVWRYFPISPTDGGRSLDSQLGSIAQLCTDCGLGVCKLLPNFAWYYCASGRSQVNSLSCHRFTPGISRYKWCVGGGRYQVGEYLHCSSALIFVFVATRHFRRAHCYNCHACKCKRGLRRKRNPKLVHVAQCRNI